MSASHYQNAVACWTGRYQPAHVGHMEILKLSLRTFHIPHLIVLATHFGWAGKGTYGIYAERNYAPEKNPLTIWERFTMMRLSLDGAGLHENVMVMVAPRPDWDWNLVSQFYPPQRVICLTRKDEFELAKAEAWKKLGEHIEFLDLTPIQPVLTTTEIRQRVRSGDDWKKYIIETVRNILPKSTVQNGCSIISFALESSNTRDSAIC